MHSDETDWEKWAFYLQQKQLIGITCFLLEAAGPIRIIAAQTLLLAKPFTSNPIVENLAEILKSDQTSQALNNFLKDKKYYG